jgi:hypothetical protein
LAPACACWLLSFASQRSSCPSLPPPPLAPPQCFPGEGPQLLAPALHRLLADLLAGRESGLVTAAALGVFARLLLHNGAAFLRMFQEAAAQVAPPVDAPPAADPAARLLLALLDLWLDRFDAIGQPAARKLSALALCALLPAPLPPLLERLELIATHVTSVWFEVGRRCCGAGGGVGRPGTEPLVLPGYRPGAATCKRAFTSLKHLPPTTHTPISSFTSQHPPLPFSTHTHTHAHTLTCSPPGGGV